MKGGNYSPILQMRKPSLSGEPGKAQLSILVPEPSLPKAEVPPLHRENRGGPYELTSSFFPSLAC